MANKHQQCGAIRERVERLGRLSSDDALVQRHATACPACAEYVDLQRWSRQVVEAGETIAEAPSMSSVWASIHRASEQAWDRALARSFRHLLPYMVAVIALILLVGGLNPSPAPTPAQVVSSAYSILNAPQVPAVAGVMTAAGLPSQDPVEMMGSRP